MPLIILKWKKSTGKIAQNSQEWCPEFASYVRRIFNFWHRFLTTLVITYVSVQCCGMGPYYWRPGTAWFYSDGVIWTKVVLRQGDCFQCKRWSASTDSNTGSLSAWCENSTGYVSCARVVSCCHCGATVKLDCHSCLVTCQSLYRYSCCVGVIHTIWWFLAGMLLGNKRK